MTDMRGLVVPMFAILFVATIGMISTQQNAYAGFSFPDCDEGASFRPAPVYGAPIVTQTTAFFEWTQQPKDVHFGPFGICDFPELFELEIDSEAPLNSPFDILDDESIPGGDGGSYLVEDLECDSTYYFDIDGLWSRSGPFGSGPPFRHVDGPNLEFTTLACEPEEDHGDIESIHCETDFDWESAYGYGHREGDGTCTVTYEDEFVDYFDVYVYGEFYLDGSYPEFDIEGEFHMSLSEEATEEDGIWIYEDGHISFSGLDYEIETTGTFETHGVFGHLGEDCELETMGEGYLTGFDYPYFVGHGERLIWITCGEEEEQQKNTGGSCTNCQPPTLGLNKGGDIDRRLVDDGFKCRGQAVDVAHFYTPFPLIQTYVGQPLVCEFKVYEDTGVSNIRHFGFAIGDRHVSLDINHLGEQTLTFDEDFFRDASLTLRPHTVDCRADGVNQCAVFDLSVVPKEPIVGDDIKAKTTVWDQKRNGKTNIYNDGIDVIGNTEKALPTFNVNDGKNGVVVLYTMDPTLEDQSFAISSIGENWYKIDGTWTKEFIAPDRSCVASSSGFNRNCSQFESMIAGQILLAEQYFNSADIQSELPDSFAYEFPEQTDRLAGTQLGD